MFLIFGIEDGEKKLIFDETAVCKCCGKYGHVEVFMTYTFFMLFFIPVFKWNKRYFVRMGCCGKISSISKDLGRAVERGEIRHINTDNINFTGTGARRCRNCGYETFEDFGYCPKCGCRF